MNKNILNKLTSRKFIIAMISAIAGVITLIVGDNEVVQIIASATMVIIPAVVYCIMEGAIDAKSIKVITEATADAAEKLGADEKTVDVIEQIGNVGGVLIDDDLDANEEME